MSVRSVSPEGVVATIRIQGAAIASPRGVASSKDGTIYVTDGATGKLFVISPRGDAKVAGPEGEGDADFAQGGDAGFFFYGGGSCFLWGVLVLIGGVGASCPGNVLHGERS